MGWRHYFYNFRYRLQTMWRNKIKRNKMQSEEVLIVATDHANDVRPDVQNSPLSFATFIIISCGYVCFVAWPKANNIKIYYIYIQVARLTAQPPLLLLYHTTDYTEIVSIKCRANQINCHCVLVQIILGLKSIFTWYNTVVELI